MAWLQPKAGTYLPTELAYEGGIYVLTHTGILTRFDAKNGAQTCKTRIETGGDFTASPWGYNGKIFCLSEEGKTYVIAAGDKFELLHSNDLDEMALATPAFVGDRLLVRTEHRLYSIPKKQKPERTAVFDRLCATRHKTHCVRPWKTAARRAVPNFRMRGRLDTFSQPASVFVQGEKAYADIAILCPSGCQGRKRDVH